MTPEERAQLLEEIEKIEFPEGAPGGIDAEEVRRMVARIATGASEAPRSNSYYEWSIKRLERRVRLLYAAVALLIVSLAVAIPLALLGGLGTGSEPIAATASSQGTDTAALSAIRARLDRIENKLEQRDAALREEVRSVRHCAARGIDKLDRGIRALVKGRVSASELLGSPALAACRSGKR